ncbi:MAG: MTH938/NDUFAF3 family protein [Vicinamibacteria bacterium]
MEFDAFSFGSIRIDGITYEHDVVIDRGEVRKRRKQPSRKLRDASGHTPLSLEEKIPWKCRRLVVGTGAHGGLPVMKEVKREAKQRKIELVILPTADALEELQQKSKKTNAILHVTC